MLVETTTTCFDCWGPDPFQLRNTSVAKNESTDTQNYSASIADLLQQHCLHPRPEHLPKQSTTNGFPHILHWVWVGDPLTREDFRSNAETTLAQRDDVIPVLWTDMNDDPDDSIRQEMLDWAARTGLWVLPFDRIFIPDAQLSCYIQLERLRRSYASVTDLMRIRILEALGGLSLDFDVVIEGPIADAFPDKGPDVRMWMELVVPCNAVMAARPRADLWPVYRQIVSEGYQKTYGELRPNKPNFGRERLFHEVLARTSPSALKRTLDRYDPDWEPDTYELDWPGLSVSYANSWLESTAVPPAMGDLQIAQEIVTVLLFEYWNRPTVLDIESLVMARPWLKHSDVAFKAAVLYLSENYPDLLDSRRELHLPDAWSASAVCL